MTRAQRARLVPRPPKPEFKLDIKLDMSSLRAQLDNRRFAALVAGAAMLAMIATPAAVSFFRPAGNAVDDPPQVASEEQRSAQTATPSADEAAANAAAATVPADSAPARAAELAEATNATPPADGPTAHRVRVEPVLAGAASAPLVDPERFASADAGGSGVATDAQVNSQRTSALAAYTDASGVKVATTEAEVTALEKAMHQVDTRASDQGNATDDATAAVPAAQSDESGGVGLVPATVRQAVNMHAGPHNGDKVLTVVPANARIRASASCTHWCTVEYEGQRGFIYKSFVSRRNG